MAEFIIKTEQFVEEDEQQKFSQHSADQMTANHVQQNNAHLEYNNAYTKQMRETRYKPITTVHQQLSTAGIPQQPPPFALPPAPPLGQQCGTVFVANNARQWTFICTFCNKSTRDIGEFIVHIKMRHLQAGSDSGAYYDDSESDIEDNIAAAYVHTTRADNYGGGKVPTISNVSKRLDQIGVSGKAIGFGTNKNLRLSSSKAIEIIPINGGVVGVSTGASMSHYQSLEERSYEDVASTTNYNRQPENTIDTNEDDSFANKQYLDCNKFLDVDFYTADPYESSSFNVPGGEPEDRGIRRFQKTTKPPKFTKTVSKKSKAKNSFLKVGGVKRKSANDVEDNDNAVDSQAANQSPPTPPPPPKSKRGRKSKKDDEDYDNQLLITPEETEMASSTSATQKRRPIRGPAYCGICSKTFRYYSLFRNHMVHHTNQTPFSCPKCEKGFKSKQALRYHVSTHERGKKHKCTVCHHAYHNPKQLVLHLKGHEDPASNTFPCMTCGKILASQKLREKHYEVHKKDNPFRCEFCDKHFQEQRHLSNHMKMHRNYRCDYCKKAFACKLKLREPITCEGCAKQMGEIYPKTDENARDSDEVQAPLDLGDDDDENDEDNESEGEGVENENGNDDANGDGDDDRESTLNPFDLVDRVVPTGQFIQSVDLSSDNENDNDGNENTEKNMEGHAILVDDATDNDDDDDDNDNEDDDYDDELLIPQHDQPQNMETHPCKFCNKKYFSLSGRRRHMRNHHKDKLDSTTRYIY